MSTLYVILAGGEGRRMHPLTRAIPKALLPVHGRAAIEFVLEEAVVASASRIVIVLQSKQSLLIKDHLGFDRSGVWRDTPVDVVETSLGTSPLEGVQAALGEEDSVIVALADEICPPVLGAWLVQSMCDFQSPCIAVCAPDVPQAHFFRIRRHQIDVTADHSALKGSPRRIVGRFGFPRASDLRELEGREVLGALKASPRFADVIAVSWPGPFHDVGNSDDYRSLETNDACQFEVEKVNKTK